MSATEGGLIYRAMGRAGRFTTRRPWLVIGAWVLVAAVIAALVMAFGRPTDEDVRLPGSTAEHGRDLLEQHFTGSDDAIGQVILRAETGKLDETVLTDAAGRIHQAAHVSAIGKPVVSTDGKTAYLDVTLDVGPRAITDQITGGVLDAAATPGLQALPAGALARPQTNTRRSEGLGIGVALVVLVFAFGGLIAAGLPLLTAIVTLVCGLGVVGLLGHATGIPQVATTLGTMIGLGVGIDYALFLITRYRALLAAGQETRTAIVNTVASSGSAVVFAGGTVIVALGGLAVAGVPILATLGWTAGLVVLVAVAAATTLLPALLMLLGPRINSLPVRRRNNAPQNKRAAHNKKAEAKRVGGSEGNGSAGGDGNAGGDESLDRNGKARGNGKADGGENAEGDGKADGDEAVESGGKQRESLWGRVADHVTGRPWPYAIVSALILLTLAAPVMSMRLGQTDPGDDPSSSVTRQGYDALATAFGPGVNGPLTVVAAFTPAASGPTDPRLTALTRAVAGTAGVAQAKPAVLAKDKTVASVRVIPGTRPSDPATLATVKRLDGLRLSGVDISVTGETAVKGALADRVGGRMAYVIGIVVVLSALLVFAAFRAPVVAAKAAVMNLLSVGAAYGVLTAVFQWGWGVRLTGLSGPVPIEAYLPMMLFALLFGLSMDYEVFLLTAVRESWERTRDNRRAVRDGLAGTGVVITSAALIMVCVFASFVLDTNPIVKMMGLGLAVAIAVDATIIRGILVPATMALLGRLNWWTPKRTRQPELDPQR